MRRRLKKYVDSRYFRYLLIFQERKHWWWAAAGSARRRIKTLLSFTPDIWVVAPEVTEELEALAEEGRIHWIQGTYAPGIHEELPQIQMALAATDDPACNEAVARECRWPRGIAGRSGPQEGTVRLFLPRLW